jgi:hypothetical protein
VSQETKRDMSSLPSWLPKLGVALALAALVVWSFIQRWNVLSASPFPIGVDGYFYPVQLRSLLETGELQYPASPLAFWLLAPFAAATDPMTGAKLGAAVLGAMFGRRGGITAGTIGKASTTAKGWMRGSKEEQDVARAQENLDTARRVLADLEREVEDAVAASKERSGNGTGAELETITIAPKRGGIHVELVAILWTKPYRG